MLTNFLLDHRWLSPLVLVVVVLLGPIAGSRLVPHRRAAWLLAGLAAVPVALLTFVPQDRRAFSRCTIDLAGWYWPTPSRVELLANVVLFVAPVLLVGVATRRPVLALVAGAATSAGIEAVQAALPALGRSCDSNDWLTNTMGAAVGAALAWLALRLARARRPVG